MVSQTVQLKGKTLLQSQQHLLVEGDIRASEDKAALLLPSASIPLLPWPLPMSSSTDIRTQFL